METCNTSSPHQEITQKKKTKSVKFGEDEHISPTESHLDLWEQNETIDCDTNYKQYIIIDVGGERHQACRESFSKYPETRLGKLVNSSDIEEILSLCEEFVPGNPPEFFFDRNPENFSAVLEMYRSGKFHIPDSARACAMVMRRDFLYWGLEELNLEACCALKFYPQVEICNTQIEGDNAEKLKEEAEKKAEDFGNSKLAKIR